jgi:formimidoylglutamate deiminase
VNTPSAVPTPPTAAPQGAALWAPRAWLPGGWADGVTLRVDAQGRWADVQANTVAPSGAQVLTAPVLPGLVNAHSHAFQRAFLAQSERRHSTHDDFWTWRDRMYGVALRITPQQLHAVACHLYTELLAGGYTHTCEFHYLHHQADGTPYADEATMCRALAQAAQDTGMGLTLLPVLYERAGFAQPQLRADQRRFAAPVARVLRLRDAVRGWGLPGVWAGVAVHSLRAAAPQSLLDLAHACAGDPGPIHIHIAEQTAEVDACLATTGARPIEWLTRQLPLDARWHLVHATHATPAEIAAVAATGAGVVLCPGTEANLGDGLCDLPAWLASGTPLAVGSDSQVTRSWPEELRWLEYGQRLHLRQRNVAAAPAQQQPATAERLFAAVLKGGAGAAGHTSTGLQPSARADLLVVNTQDPAFAGVPNTHLLDAVVFAAAAQPFSHVMANGRWLTLHDAAQQGRAAAAMAALSLELLDG